MKKSISLVVAVGLLGSPAWSQVRPQDCQPVFPVVDRVASVLPQDVVAEAAAPALAAKKGFLGLPLLFPLLAGLGGAAALIGGGGGGGGGGSSQPVSPA